jgi:CheY-like chemotaxis protein
LNQSPEKEVHFISHFLVNNLLKEKNKCFMKKIALIVLIDDNEADNMYHKYVMEKANIANEIIAMQNSLDALEYLKKCLSITNKDIPIPELVFLDINMPALNGIELLEKLQETPGLQENKMKIFMLTSSLNPDDKLIVQKKFPKLISGFKIKPLTAEMLHDIIEKKF